MPWLLSLILLVGCANPALKRADELASSGRHPEALHLVSEAAAADPRDHELQLAIIRHRERAAHQLALHIDMLRNASRWADALAAVEQLKGIDPRYPRIVTLSQDIQRGQRIDAWLADAKAALQTGKLEPAEARLREVLSEAPGHAQARLLMQQLTDRQSRDAPIAAMELAPAFQRPVTLEFREAPLRNVFEALTRTSGLNFVFDKDMRADAKVSVFLRNVSVDEAMRVVLSTQQLDRKLLNPETVLIYPNNPGKQRELQDLLTRTIYLANTPAKEAEKMVRNLAKVRDVHMDERINALVIRDTAEVIRLVERMIASIDIPEPEVMLEVEVMEVSSDAMDAIGLKWADQVSYGLLGSNATTLISQRGDFRAWTSNPVLTATLRGTSGSSNLLANPRIRVRNREKAKVQIGEKLPVFTTTSSINIGISTSVSYLDVGLKLEVEPLIGTDNDVGLKLALEVSNILGQVSGPSGSIAYQVGTRLTNTSLRLADGETQIISGLISDEDRKSAAGVPGLSRLPVAGSLFGLRTNNQNKTEIVLLLTPRIVRGMAVPDTSLTRLPAGNDANPGAFHTGIRGASTAGAGVATPTISRPATAPALQAPRSAVTVIPAPPRPVAAPEPGVPDPANTNEESGGR